PASALLPTTTPSPYTTLFRSSMDRRTRGCGAVSLPSLLDLRSSNPERESADLSSQCLVVGHGCVPFLDKDDLLRGGRCAGRFHQDRKSTRLNSSHRTTSYASF